MGKGKLFILTIILTSLLILSSCNSLGSTNEPVVDYNECKCIVDYAKVGTTKNVQAVIDSVKEKGTIVFVEVKPLGYQSNYSDSIVVVWYKEKGNAEN